MGAQRWEARLQDGPTHGTGFTDVQGNCVCYLPVADLCFHCSIGQQAPLRGPGLPAGTRWERRHRSPQSCGPSSPSIAPPRLSSPRSPCLPDKPALPGWAEGTGVCHLGVSGSLGTPPGDVCADQHLGCPR